MSLQAVHLLPAVCPGEEGGTGERRGTRPAPGGDPRPREGTLGPAAAARPLRWVALGSWEWGLGRPPPAGTGSPGTPATPSPLLPASAPLGAFPQQLLSRTVLKIRPCRCFSPPVQMNYATAWRGRAGTPPISKAPLFGSHVIPTDNASHACFLPRK